MTNAMLVRESLSLSAYVSFRPTGGMEGRFL